MKQNNLREQINILSMKQAQLIEMIQKEPETVSHQELWELGQQTLRLQQDIEDMYKNSGLAQMKRLNEVSNCLANVLQQIGVQE